MTVQEIAANAATKLRDTLQPGIFGDTRRDELTTWRSALAQAMAEEETGVTFNEARLLSIYSASQLTKHQIDRAHAYNRALLAAYQRLNGDFVTFLARCDELAVDPVAA